MKVFAVLSLLIFSCCSSSKQIVSNGNLVVSLNKMDCGSFEVRNYETTIGYVVKPYIIELETRHIEIANF